MEAATRAGREQAFWDASVPPLDACLEEYVWGRRNENVGALLDSLEPLDGRDVLDVACGTGLLSVWLAERGACVTGIDLSAPAVERAREVCAELGVAADFRVGDVTSGGLDGRRFDRLAGRYALHHLDVAAAAPALAAVLRPGGCAAFLETVDSNPVLRVSRRVVGRFGVSRLGSLDERPLARRDFDVLARSFGRVEVRVARMSFLQLADRQLLRYRSRRVSALLAGADAALLRATGWKRLSYHQVVVLAAPRAC